MKRLLRGVIDFEDGKISEENLLVNLQRLIPSGIEWQRPEDQRIYQFVRDFFERNLAVPSARVILDYFHRKDDIEVQDRMEVIQDSAPYQRTNYAHLLEQLFNDLNRVRMLALCNETKEIITKGIEVKEGKKNVKLQGTKDAILHFNTQASNYVKEEYAAKTKGDLRDEAVSAWDDYLIAKHNKGKVWGGFTGIEEIDSVCKGIRRGEMWVHAGYTGELKTTFAINWCYNLVTRYRKNILYCSFEMPYVQIRNKVLARHSAHPKFLAKGSQPLVYTKIRDGELSNEEEKFYKEVLEDWDNSQEYCQFNLWCPNDEDVGVSDVRLYAELLHKNSELGLIVLDHSGLMKAPIQNRDYVVTLNSTLRASKKLALHFNHGEGIPVLMIHQINRDGKEAADKTGGQYKIRALSYSNECEKSADTITTTYINDEHKENGTSVCCCLKNRDNPLFRPFLLGVDLSCGRMHRLDPDSLGGNDLGTDEQDSIFNALMDV